MMKRNIWLLCLAAVFASMSSVGRADDEETIEIYAFMSAADESQAQGGAPVSIAKLIEQARGEK